MQKYGHAVEADDIYGNGNMSVERLTTSCTDKGTHQISMISTLPDGRVSALNAQHLHQLLFQLAQHPFRFVVGHLVHARVTQVVEDFLIRQIEQR